MMAMYRQHCVFIMCTNRVTRKIGNALVSMLRAAGRHTEITTDYRKISQSFLRNPPVIAFEEADRPELERQMRAAGIDPTRPCVVFGLRDMAYYTFYGDVMKIPLTKQGRRAETHHRCPSLSSYLTFAQYWAERGHQVIRMGLRVSDVVPAGSHPNIIDYASGPRSDELDAWLFATCRFMVAGDTGLFSGAAAFDRPSVLSDLFLIQNTMYSSNKTTRNLFVPKLIRDLQEDRLLSFRELVYFNHHFSFFEDCQADGFAIVHNEPEDILAATIELDERLEGRFVESSEDRELQAAYHALYPPRFRGHRSTGLISAAFLRKHAKLLD
jgi:putative glycosyltransferase (TIGR04372 family)